MDSECTVTEWAKTLAISFVAVYMILYVLEPDMVMKIKSDGYIVICYRKLVSVALMISIVITVTTICIEGTNLIKSEMPMSIPRLVKSNPNKFTSTLNTY